MLQLNVTEDGKKNGPQAVELVENSHGIDLFLIIVKSRPMRLRMEVQKFLYKFAF